MLRQDKPILTAQKQIEHLIKKGINFEIVTESEAKKYLEENNNYFKLTAFRKNYDKHISGENIGKYIKLDFAMLKDLSIIDMRLRYIMIHLSLDIEHFAKVKLLKELEVNDEDGYEIVDEYYKYLMRKDSGKWYDKLLLELKRNKDNPYCGGIISKYDKNYPAWAFVEIISLGTFTDFYLFCAKKFDNDSMKKEHYLLRSINQLRNASAHSNCILNDLNAKNSSYKVDYEISQAINTIPREVRNKKLKNKRIAQVVTMLYAHSKIVTSYGVKRHIRKELRKYCNRMFQRQDLYKSNDVIISNFKFLSNCIDIFYK